MKLNNPFVISGYRGPEYFCDRVEEIKRLCTLVRNESNVTLLAPRRYGKTGLVFNVFEQLRKKDGYETIYVDVFGTQNLAEFTSALAHEVIGRFDTPLDDIFAYLKEHEKRVVVAIDEFQQVAEYPEKGVEAKLRSLVQFCPAQFIFAGSKQHLMREMFTSPKRPFYQSTTLMPLDAIAEEPYFKFAQKFFTDAHRRLSHEVFDAIYRRFDGITWYVQALLWDFYARGGDAVKVADVDELVAARVAANEYESQRVLTLLPNGARRLLKAIAHEGVVKEPQAGAFIAAHGLRAASSVRVSLKTLVDAELVYPGSDGYRVYDRLMGEYLKK